MSLLQTGDEIGDVKAGDLVIAGKTKEIWTRMGYPNMVIAYSTDRITAGDGARSDIIPGKGVVSNRTTCAVFNYLMRRGIPTAYMRKVSDAAFLARKCRMLPLEVINRRVAPAGASVLKREPDMPVDKRFDPPRFELFLKTTGEHWKEHQLECDDPYIQIDGQYLDLFHPKKPLSEGRILRLHQNDVFDDPDDFGRIPEIEKLSRKIFELHEVGLKTQGFELIDGKDEFGVGLDGRLYLADVRDAESIRVKKDGKHFDKQPYRNGVPAADMLEKFSVLMEASERMVRFG